jgi:hypothetical protein
LPQLQFQCCCIEPAQHLAGIDVVAFLHVKAGDALAAVEGQ